MIADRWGVDDGEVARHYPCDDVVVRPTLSAWRGVTVHAPRDVLWPWVTQIRLAPYSYDWVDNRGRRSPRTLQPLPPPVVGEHFTASGGRGIGRILSVQPPEQLTGRIGGAVLSYVLVAHGSTTRLLLKVVMAGGRLVAPVVSVGDLVMARRQLLTFKALAEQGHSATVGRPPSRS